MHVGAQTVATQVRRHAGRALVLTILLVCVVVTLRLFDWRTIGQALTHLRIGLLLGLGLPLLLAASAIRGWRWLIVLGARPGWANFQQSFYANAAAAGLASLTPFQLGEAVKIRLIPDRHGTGWRIGASAFFVERLLDLGTLSSIGVGGLAIKFGHAWAVPLALLSPLAGSVLLSLVCRHVPLPSKAVPYIEVLRNTSRVAAAAILTIPLWMLYVALWWIAMHAMNVNVDLIQVSILLGGVMLAVVASMTPGGLGVSELSSRSMLLWLGASPADAEIGAIAIRLLTPLVVMIGLFCLLPLFGKSGIKDNS